MAHGEEYFDSIGTDDDKLWNLGKFQILQEEIIKD